MNRKMRFESGSQPTEAVGAGRVRSNPPWCALVARHRSTVLRTPTLIRIIKPSLRLWPDTLMNRASRNPRAGIEEDRRGREHRSSTPPCPGLDAASRRDGRYSSHLSKKVVGLNGFAVEEEGVVKRNG